MGTPNIFHIANSDLVMEDRFTALLHYLIDSIPSIGQGMVDVICEKSGLPPATFQMAEDHPAGNAESKPDFLLSCKEFNLLCEHKLESELGNRQLERYRDLLKDRPSHLVLISNRTHEMAEEVLQSNQYLRPNGSGIPHFHWEDFYPVIANHKERLARDFAVYMRGLGMATSPLPDEWNRLFRDKSVAEKFYEATMDMRSYFGKQLGAQCKADPSKLGFQVKYPTTWLHLLYFDVSKVAKPPPVGMESPFLRASVFVKDADSRHTDQLEEAEIQTEDGLILGRAKNSPARWGENLVWRYEVLGSLNDYLTGSTTETRAKLRRFGKTVFELVTSASL